MFLKTKIVTILLFMFHAVYSQCDNIFYNTPQFTHKALWELNFEINKNWLNSNYLKACELALQIDTSLLKTNQIDFNVIISSFSHMSKNDLALQWLKLAKKHSGFTCMTPTASKNILSDAIYNSDGFKECCPEYPINDLANISHPQLRDSIIKYIIYTHNGLKLQPFIDSGHGHYYDSVPNYPLDKLNEIAWNKISMLFKQYGYPTEKMIGRRNILMAVFLFIAHQPEVYQLEEFRDLMICKVPPELTALLEDKISIAKKEKQKYGTQFIRNETGATLCEVTSRKDIDKFRMAAGLSPIKYYMDRHGLKWPE